MPCAPVVRRPSGAGLTSDLATWRLRRAHDCICGTLEAVTPSGGLRRRAWGGAIEAAGAAAASAVLGFCVALVDATRPTTQ